MASQERPSLQVSPEELDEGRAYALEPHDWLELCAFVVEFLLRGGSPMLYQSKDGNALCLSLKSGKEGRKYWIGPEEVPMDIVAKASREWGVGMSPDNPVMLAAADLSEEAIERLRAAGLE